MSLLECQFCVGIKVEIFGIECSQVVKSCFLSVYFLTEFMSNEKNDEEQCPVGTADPVPFKAEEFFAPLSTGVKVFMVFCPSCCVFQASSTPRELQTQWESRGFQTLQAFQDFQTWQFKDLQAAQDSWVLGSPISPSR